MEKSLDKVDLAYLKGLRVLYVEDDNDTRKQLIDMMHHWVNVVDAAEDGQQGLEAFKAHTPDIVVTDILMPVMDGLTMCAHLRELSPAVPIVIATAFEETSFLRRSIDLGIDKYIVKPIVPEQMLNALLTCARQQRAEAALLEIQERYRVLFKLTNTGIAVADPMPKPDAVGVAHMDGFVIDCNDAYFTMLGYKSRDEVLGHSIFELTTLENRNAEKHVINTQLFVNGFTSEYEKTLSRADGSTVPVVSQLILRRNAAGEPIEVWEVMRDITPGKRAEAEIKHYIDQLEHTTEATLQAVAALVEQRDPYTAGHERRVGELAAAIGTEMGLSEHTVKGLRLTGFVHDVGKIGVPSELLSRPKKLTPLEFELIKVHAQAGYDVLKNVDFPWPVAEVILQHHERLDGSGYPRGLRSGEILLETRVLSVADVVEAISSHRPYRPGLGITYALNEIEKQSGTGFDPVVVAACLRLFREKAFVMPE